MNENSTRQSASKARIRRLRAQYRKRMAIIGVIFFILGAVAGVFAYRWYAGRTPDTKAQATAEITPQPEQTQAAEQPQGEAEQPAAEPETAREGEAAREEDGEEINWNIWGAQDGEVTPEQAAFPEVEAAEGDAIFPEDDGEIETQPAEEEAQAVEAADAAAESAAEEATPEPTEAPTPVPDMSSDEVAEFDPAGSEVSEEYLTLTDENGQAEAAPAEEAPVEGEGAAEAVDAAPAEAQTAAEGETAVDGEAAPEEEAVSPSAYGPQVVAIVPYGESFTYETQIKADGNARVEATDEPYETVRFTQTMKSFMRPTDFAAKYSTQYKLQGNEAGAGFELILNDYTGEATIVPQNVIDISLRSESGNSVERGYQLMDAEISGNYGVALTTNTPKVFYKRYQYSAAGEEMAYLVVTTYNDGETRQILFQLESDEPEPEPEIVYPTLQKGLKSDDVKALQQRLIDLGYLSGAADGSFGGMTEEAIKKAQAAFGMEENGIADNGFQQKLYEGVEAPVPTEAPAVTYKALKLNDKGQEVVALQLKLRELGYYDGKADGGYGPMTQAAVKKAQAAFGMEETGTADDALQQRLYGTGGGDEAAQADASSVG